MDVENTAGVPSRPKRKLVLRVFLLHRGKSETVSRRLAQFERAAQSRGLVSVTLDAASFSPDFEVAPQAGDLMVNVGRGCRYLETALWREGLRTLRSVTRDPVENDGDTVVISTFLERLGYPTPKTHYGLPQTAEDAVAVARALGGLPLVIKGCGGSGGTAKMIVESERSLVSVVEHLLRGGEEFIIQEFLEHSEQFRLIVLGGTPVVALSRPIRSHDFRSTLGDTESSVVQLDREVEQLMLSAAAEYGYDLSGVDFVIHPTRGPIILEVNPPCGLLNLEFTGIDVEGLVLDYLIEKPV